MRTKQELKVIKNNLYRFLSEFGKIHNSDNSQDWFDAEASLKDYKAYKEELYIEILRNEAEIESILSKIENLETKTSIKNPNIQDFIKKMKLTPTVNKYLEIYCNNPKIKNREVAELLRVDIKTVESHKKSLVNKIQEYLDFSIETPHIPELLNALINYA